MSRVVGELMKYTKVCLGFGCSVQDVLGPITNHDHGKQDQLIPIRKFC